MHPFYVSTVILCVGMSNLTRMQKNKCFVFHLTFICASLVFFLFVGVRVCVCVRVHVGGYMHTNLPPPP